MADYTITVTVTKSPGRYTFSWSSLVPGSPGEVDVPMNTTKIIQFVRAPGSTWVFRNIGKCSDRSSLPSIVVVGTTSYTEFSPPPTVASDGSSITVSDHNYAPGEQDNPYAIAISDTPTSPLVWSTDPQIKNKA